MKTRTALLGTIGMFALIIGAGIMTGCSTSNSQQAPAAKTHTYYCPMHPDVVQNSPGKCPKCGMDLTEKQ